jgi:acyl-CoA synthetase (AMP-forming)/AMP-acid ligase II
VAPRGGRYGSSLRCDADNGGWMSETDQHHATIWEGIADRLADRPALRHGSRVTTWAELDDRAARLAGALVAHGVGFEDSVGLYLYNGPEYFETFFAALKIRARPFNANYRYRGNELRHLLENAEARVLVYSASLRDRVASAVEHNPDLRLLVEVGDDDTSPPIPGARRLEDLLAEHDPAPRIERSGSDTYLNYTGGTTGLPKGVLVEIRRHLGTVTWFRDQYVGRTLEGDPVDIAVTLAESGESLAVLPASPLMHGVGFTFSSLPGLLSGGVVTTLESRSFDAHELLTTIPATQSQVIAVVGDAFSLPVVRALDEASRGGAPYDTSSVRVICSAGVAWSAPIKARLLDHIPAAALIDACGCTEGVSYGTRTVRRGDPLSTANFVAAPGLKVVTPQGDEVPPGVVGLLAGPTQGTGYFRNPEQTALTYLHIGDVQYAIPGDLGRIEPDGTVTLIGRGVSTINTGGEKVHPAEVEDVIKALPLVDDCLVLGVPDERLGQRVAALIVPAPGAVLDLDDLRAAIRGELAGYKVPSRVRLVDEVPRAPNGKIDHPAASALAEAADVSR